MMKHFDPILKQMGELEQILEEREMFWQATQVKVLRGFLSAIALGTMTKPKHK